MGNIVSKSLVAKSALLFGTAFVALAGASAASAQDAPAAAAAVQTPAADDNLGDIVVTSQRRSENLQKVPV